MSSEIKRRPGGRTINPTRGGRPSGRRVLVRVSGTARSAQLSIEHLPRTSDRGAATRGALLAAARDVFSVSGFAQAAVTDIVAKAGASVGSLYHHFSGKADLYLTLFEEFQTASRSAPAKPSIWPATRARATRCGCSSPAPAPTSTVASPSPTWPACSCPATARPGFDRALRDRLRTWARRNAALFHAGDGEVDEALVVVLTGAMSGAVSEVSLSEDEAASQRLADDVLTIISRLESTRDRRP